MYYCYKMDIKKLQICNKLFANILFDSAREEAKYLFVSFVGIIRIISLTYNHAVI